MRLSILYLDDEPMCLNLFMSMLGTEFDVRTARDHAEAHRRLSERRAEIIISDQKMPEVDGTQFLREVAGKYPESCRVLLTGSVTVGEMFSEICQGDIHFFLAKPWTEQDMRQMLDRAGFILAGKSVAGRSTEAGAVC